MAACMARLALPVPVSATDRPGPPLSSRFRVRQRAAVWANTLTARQCHTDGVISVSVMTDSHSRVLLFLEENMWSELGRPIRHRLGLVIGAQPLNDNKSDGQKIPHYSFLFDS